jgi:hypothetical protein
MSNSPSVTIIIVKHSEPGMLYNKHGNCPFYCFVASNPDIWESGNSEEEALNKIKYRIKSNIVERRVYARAVEINFDELITEEVHNS